MCHILMKIIVLGESNVGKTSLLRKLVEKRDLSIQVPTIGVDFFTSFVDVNNQRIKLQIWDTAGQEIFKAIISHYYKVAIGGILVFDLSNKESFENCEYWIKEYLKQRNYAKIILVGNKSDLSEDVTSQEIEVFCEKYNCKYIKCSLLKNFNINKIFESLTEEILKDYENNIFNDNEEGFILKSKLSENRITLLIQTIKLKNTYQIVV